MTMTRVTASKMTPNEMIALLFAQNADIIRLTEERDAARREVCVSLNGNMKQAHEYAASRDWDCFKNQETQ